ncbi:hypothetical protein FO519_006393 [Halicephalobus sp. NKZ332]|nr:hypothetical protein FO519_006393 [Halicephalobus sp. NKZ332]
MSLIIMGSGWGTLPHKYLRVVLYIQDLFSKFHEFETEKVPVNSEPMEKPRCILSRTQSTVTAEDMEFQFDVDKENVLSVLDVGVDLAASGIQAIVQDEVSGMFGYSPFYLEFEFTSELWKKLQSNVILKFIYVLSLGFRYGFLFPVRICLLSSSFAFTGFWCIVVLFFDLPNKTKTWIAVVYCRLFCAGTGLVATYHNQEKKPKRPGIAVANHLSPNDIQIICADVEPDREYLYTVTGQKHTGIIWAIERLVERLCPSLWFDRANMKDRREFTNLILEAGKKAGPVLLFPEGHCTNNTKVLQFRKAVFIDDIVIHPIAIKQDARFGDSYWSEDLFYHYLIRLLSSWATVYDIYYLDSQRKHPNENSDEFASRIQASIAEAIGTTPAFFDGSVWYKQQEKDKYKNALKEKCANQFSEIVPIPEEVKVIENNHVWFSTN